MEPLPEKLVQDLYRVCKTGTFLSACTGLAYIRHLTMFHRPVALGMPPIYYIIYIYTSSFARFSYSECGLRSLRSLTHMGVMSSLASATPSVAYAPLAHSHVRDEFARFSYSECGLRSLTHMGVMRQGGNDILVITYTKCLRARAAHNMGNLRKCNVHEKPPSIAPSLPPSVPAYACSHT